MESSEPFSRHRRPDERPDEHGLARAAEFAAHEYGWRPDYLAGAVTDEQLVWYFDAAHDRLEQHATAEYERAVEAVRVGTIFAHDAKQYTSWRNRTRSAAGRGRGLVGAELEAAVMRIASVFPGNVIQGAAA